MLDGNWTLIPAIICATEYEIPLKVCALIVLISLLITSLIALIKLLLYWLKAIAAVYELIFSYAETSIYWFNKVSKIFATSWFLDVDYVEVGIGVEPILVAEILENPSTINLFVEVEDPLDELISSTFGTKVIPL